MVRSSMEKGGNVPPGAQHTVAIRLTGAIEDGGYLRLTEFLRQLESLKESISHIDHLVSGSDSASVYYRIVELRQSSPAVIRIQPCPLRPSQDFTGAIVSTFFEVLDDISTVGEVRRPLDQPVLESFKKLGRGLHGHVTEIVIENGRRAITIGKDFERKIDVILGEDEEAEGSIPGVLEAINVHNNANVFSIYPPIGPKKVDCRFGSNKDLLAKAVASIGQMVDVSGTIRYRSRQKYPYAITAKSLETYPPEEELPTLMDLKGIAPNATGDMSSEDFIRSIRDAER